MTSEEREDAINFFKEVEKKEVGTYCKLAIKALDQQTCEDAVSRQAVLETIDVCNSDGLKGIFCSYDDGERFKAYIKGLPPVTPKQQTCEDAISREAVLDIIMPYCKDDDGSAENTGDLRNALDDIESLPPATSKEKTGKWIYTGDYITDGMLKCTSCGYEHDVADRFLYCPNCGARMVESQESEDTDGNS